MALIFHVQPAKQHRNSSLKIYFIKHLRNAVYQCMNDTYIYAYINMMNSLLDWQLQVPTHIVPQPVNNN